MTFMRWTLVVLAAACACKRHHDDDMITFPPPPDPPPSASVSSVAASAPTDTGVTLATSASIAPVPSGSAPMAMLAVLGGIDAGSSDVFGSGGLGATGTGPGGGTGEGIGLGTIGTLGHGRSSAHVRQGATTVNGRLPPEVIQRIVRQHFGAMRACYVDGLRRNPTLAGAVVTRFIIDRQGNVSSASRDAGTTIADSTVASCITHVFSTLVFPAPEGGIVTVVYPIHFDSGDSP